MNNYCSNNMCYRNYQMPQKSFSSYRDSSIPYNYSSTDGVGYNQSFTNNSGIYHQASSDDRFFFAPFLVGGLAGTALGYGIANNNQIKGGYYMPPPPIYYYPSPAPYTYNNYYY